MWIAIVLVVGSVVLLVAAFTHLARREAVERARAIEALRPTPLEEVTAGRLTAVRAKAASEAPLDDPVTGEPVVFHETRVARTDGGERTLCTVRRGDTFLLEDETARVEVRLTGTEPALAWREVEDSERVPSPRMRTLIEDTGALVPEPERGARYALFHRAIAVGDLLTVVGTPAPEGATPTREGYRGGKGVLPRFVSGAEGLVVTHATLESVQQQERADLRAMRRMLEIATLVGVLLIVLGAGLMVAG